MITAIRGMLLLALRRILATPHLSAIRFAGLLVAVTLVSGVSLYSGAMGDAMLRQRRSRLAREERFEVCPDGARRLRSDSIASAARRLLGGA